MTEDLTVFFADFGVPVAFGGYSTKALFDKAGTVQDLGGLPITVQEDSILYATDALPGLKKDSAITVDSTAYTVRNVTKQDDGKVSRATLRLA